MSSSVRRPHYATDNEDFGTNFFCFDKGDVINVSATAFGNAWAIETYGNENYKKKLVEGIVVGVKFPANVTSAAEMEEYERLYAPKPSRAKKLIAAHRKYASNDEENNHIQVTLYWPLDCTVTLHSMDWIIENMTIPMNVKSEKEGGEKKQNGAPVLNENEEDTVAVVQSASETRDNNQHDHRELEPILDELTQHEAPPLLPMPNAEQQRKQEQEPFDDLNVVSDNEFNDVSAKPEIKLKPKRPLSPLPSYSELSNYASRFMMLDPEVAPAKKQNCTVT